MRKAFPLVLASALALGACTATSDDPILISGSSTVYPITERIAADNKIAVSQEAEGTLDGFERFCSGQTHINNASIAIPGAGQPIDYLKKCADNNVEFIELPIGLDALSIVRNLDNDFAYDLSLDELKAIWEPNSQIKTWADVRSTWPDEEIKLFGRPEGSGTFDYFTALVVGEPGNIRTDYESTDDLTELAEWIAEEPNALGFMGVGNYLSADEDYRNRMSTVSVDGVEPTLSNAQSGAYTPLTRPLFIYVSLDALESREDVREFTAAYLNDVYEVLPREYFYRLSKDDYAKVSKRLEQRTTGSLFDGDPHQDADISSLLG